MSIGVHRLHMLKLITEGREQAKETKFERARRLYGKPFAGERGCTFEWVSHPTVLNAWLQNRQSTRRKQCP